MSIIKPKLSKSESLWAAKKLLESGFFSEEIAKQVEAKLAKYVIDDDYYLTKIQSDFYTELAKGLRPLWPEGEKDGKFPWRDSVTNLSKRLETLWSVRNLGEYPMDTCLTVARQYLAQFEHNAKYMKTLKYFILKQDKLVQKDGRIRYIWQSPFADMLESSSTMSDMDDEQVFESTLSFDFGGELV